MGPPDGKRSGTDGSICKICWKGPNSRFNSHSTIIVAGKSQATGRAICMVARTTYRGDNKIAKFYLLHQWANFNHLSKRLMSNNQVIAPFRWSTKAERSDPFIGPTNTSIKHAQFDVRG